VLDKLALRSVRTPIVIVPDNPVGAVVADMVADMVAVIVATDGGIIEGAAAYIPTKPTKRPMMNATPAIALAFIEFPYAENAQVYLRLLTKGNSEDNCST
jgi:hypothetical protein